MTTKPTAFDNADHAQTGTHTTAAHGFTDCLRCLGKGKIDMSKRDDIACMETSCWPIVCPDCGGAGKLPTRKGRK